MNFLSRCCCLVPDDDKLRLGVLNGPFPRVPKLVEPDGAFGEMQRFVRPIPIIRRGTRTRTSGATSTSFVLARVVLLFPLIEAFMCESFLTVRA